MTSLNQVRRLIERLSPEPICDDCISERIEGSAYEHTISMSRELAGPNGFERTKDACSICSAEKLVTRYRSKKNG